MVRETRHLWVGNLPDNIREERIREHFKRYGRVQSVKILSRSKEEVALGGSGVCATVSFMDIKSASKAHNVEQKLDDRCLSTEYHEPAAIPSASPTIPPHLYPAPARPYIHGSPLEELGGFERSSHFYDREREASYRGRPAAPSYHVVSPIQGSPDPLRNRPRDRTVFRAYPPLESVVTSSRGHHHRVGSWNYEGNGSRYGIHLNGSPDLTYPEDRVREPSLIIVRNKQILKPSDESRDCSEDRCGSGSPTSSSSGASHSGGSSSCSSSSSPSPPPQLLRSPSPGPALSDKSSSSHSHHGSLKSSTGPSHASGVQIPQVESPTSFFEQQQRHFAICIKNLPLRSSDTSLKDGLYHEYKRHGKVTCVKVVGQGCDRYALVFFKKTEDVEKALQVSHDKSFFGSKIEVSTYQGHRDVDDNESRPIETDVDEFHSKATRTLFIGNLNSNSSAADLRKTFETFGEIIEIDIKKGNNINGSTTGTYAFVQYIDISSVVKAMRTMDGEFLSGSRINLGFGKSLATSCVWIDGVAESVSEKYLASHFNQFGSVTHCVIDRSRDHALVFFQQITHAQLAVTQMRGSIMKGRKLQVDFASRECQQGFYEHLDKLSSESSPRFTSQTQDNTVQLSPGSTNGVTIRGFETPSSSCSSAAGDKNYPRNPEEPRSNLISVPNPQDIHNLQKERVSLLEQLEDCNSSGDELLNDSTKAKQVKSHPGTPLIDERPPESLTPPTQVPRSHVPISLPLPRFAVHVSNPLLSPPLSSPRRPQSSNSDDSQASDPGAPGLEERLRNLDEKYEQWSGSRTNVLKLDASVRLRSRYKLLDTVDKLEPSDIVKSVLAKPSVFDEDTKRLENFSDKYIPKEFIPSRTSPNLPNIRHQQLGSFSPMTPSSSGSSKSPPASSPAAVKTQYSFPSHPHPVTITQNCRTSPTDPRMPISDPRLLIDPRVSVADPRLSADSRGSFLTKQNICTINDNRYVPDILNTKDPRHPIHKDAEIKDGPEAFYRSKIRDEYTKNWLHTFDRKDNEPTYKLVDPYDRRRFSDFRKEEEEKLKIEQINKQKLLDGFVVKRKCSNETVVHPSPFFVGVQEKQKSIDELKKLTEHKKVEEMSKRDERERIEIRKVPEDIKPPEPPPTVNSLTNIDEDKIDFITNENTIANILLSSIEHLHRKNDPEETRSKVERINSNECVSKHSDTEKKKEVIIESIKKHERKKSIEFDHTKVKEKKDHESKKSVLGSKSKDSESNNKSKELEFNMFEINRINNKKKEELMTNCKVKDIDKKKDVPKLEKKLESRKEDKKKEIVKETDKKDDVEKVKDKKKDKRDKDPPKHKERKKSLDENNKHKHESTNKRSKEHYKCKEEEKTHKAVTPDFDGKFNDDKESKKDKRVDTISISSNSSTGRSSKRRMSDSSENLDDSKRSKIDTKSSKDNKNQKKTNDKHISFISKILDGKNKEQKKDHHEKKLEKKKDEKKAIKTPNQTETDDDNDDDDDDDDDDDEEARERRKNHSIFEVVLDEPYVSMYDKVKARSTKNMQKQEEEKRQEKLKEKFNQLKQSRAKREEKKRSTSYDGDSDSDRGLRRSSKLLITSSDDDDDYFRRKNQRPVSDSSENERPKIQRTMSDSYENNKTKTTQRRSDSYEIERLKSQRAISDSSENEKFKRLSKFKSRIQSECSDSDDHFVRVRKSSFTFDRIQNDVHGPACRLSHQKKKKQKKQKSEYSRKSIDINGTDSNYRPIKEKKKKHSIGHKSNMSEKMQDIFGSLSDEDNDKTSDFSQNDKTSDYSHNKDNKPSDNKWNVAAVFGTDSDTEHERKENKPKMEVKKFNESGKDVLKSLSHNVDEVSRKKKKRKKDKERSKEERKEERREDRKEERREARRDDHKDARRDDHKEVRRDDHKDYRRDDHKDVRRDDHKEVRRDDHKEIRRDDHKEVRRDDRRDVHLDRKEDRRDDRKEERRIELRENRRIDRKEYIIDDQIIDLTGDDIVIIPQEIKSNRLVNITKDERKSKEIRSDRIINLTHDERKVSKEIKSDRIINLTHEERKVSKEIKSDRIINLTHEERKVSKETKSDKIINLTHEDRKVSKEIKSDRIINLTHEDRKVSKEIKSDRIINLTHEDRKVPRESREMKECREHRESKHYEEIKVMDNLQSIIESKKKPPKEFVANKVNSITPNRDVFSTFFDFDDSKGPQDETITIFKGDDDTVKTEVMFRKVDEKKELLFRPINTFEPIKREIIGFGSQMDDETAVKSISEANEPLIEEADLEEMSSPEEKSAPVISQEETEGAVAALLLEASFGQDFCDSSYSDRSAKPDTPVSDSELRIDTDDDDGTDSIDECKNDILDSTESSGNLSKVDDNEVIEKQEKKVSVVGNEKMVISLKSDDEPKSLDKPQLPELQHELQAPAEHTDTKPQSPLSHNFRLPQMVIQQTSIRPLNINNYTKPLAEVKPPPLASQEIPEIIVVESVSKPEPKTEDHVSVVKFSTTQIPTVICQEQSVISCAPPVSLPIQDISQPSVLQHTKDTQIVQSCIVSLPPPQPLPPISLPEIEKPSLVSKPEILEEKPEEKPEEKLEENLEVPDEPKHPEETPINNQTTTITYATKLITFNEKVQPEEILTPISILEEPLSPVPDVAPVETEDKLIPKHPKAKGLERIVEQINEKIRAKANESVLNLTREPRIMPLKKSLTSKDNDEIGTEINIEVLDIKSKIVDIDSPEGLVVTPLTPKIEDKNEVFASPGESSCEPKELDTARIKKDDEFAKVIPKVVERDSAVRGRRRGGRGRGSRGSHTLVTPRRTRQNIVTPNMPQQTTLTDVYEFTDEDEKVNQKYSKSPEPPVMSVTPTVPSAPLTGAVVVNTSPLTRKSRRLQEKDGSKSTLEETIDEVARGPCTRRTTRSKPQAIPLLSLEKSPRKTKQINGKKLKAESPPPMSKLEIIDITDEPNDEKDQLLTSMSSLDTSSSSETTTLIDPVSGLLIPMQESEEGQYVPIDNRDLRGKRSLQSDEPPEKKARLEKTPVTSTATSKNSTTIPALAVTPNNIHPATTTTYAVTPGMSNVAKTPCVMTVANSAPIGLVKPNITASVIAPTNIVKSTAVMAPSPPPLKTQTTTLKKISHPVISQQPICKPTTQISSMPPPIKSHLNTVSRTPPLPKLLSPKGHIVQAYTSQSVEPNNQNSVVVCPPSTPPQCSQQPLLVHASVMSPPLRGVLNSPIKGVLSPTSRGLLSPPSRTVPPLQQSTPIVHNSSAVPDVIRPKGFDPSKVENSRCIVMRSPPSPLVLPGQPLPFEAGIDSTPINLVPAHHFMHPQLIYPHYLRDSMGAFIPTRNMKVAPEVEENIPPPLELRKRLPDECITDRLPIISGTQQYLNVQQHSRPIGCLPFGQVVPVNYGYRPIHSVLKDFPIYWQGTLALKNDKALVEMHYLFGNAAVAEHSLQRNIDGELKLSQRMRLEQTQLDGVTRKLQIEDECCVLIAVPIGMNEEEWNQQSCTLHNGFITYLQQKQAAGIINITAPGSTQNAYIVHMFPPCDYINSILAEVHPEMVKDITSMAHLIIVIATV